MKRKQAILWILMIAFVLCITEGLTSMYYFQRGYDAPFAIVQFWQGVKNRMIQSRLLKPKTGHYVSDDRFGWTIKKNTQFVPDYCGSNDVKYTTGPNGERLIPKPKDPAGQILFIGGSRTFGHCVCDNENYPYILATEYWKKWEVQNMAVTGYGTTQAYMRLSDSINSDSPPSMVIYGMFEGHIHRNYLRREWLQMIGKSFRKHPHFELMNGDLVFQGTVGLSSGIEDGLELRKKEYELTSAFLIAMQQMCAKKNIPFIVIFLPPGDSYPLPVIDKFYRSNIRFVDLAALVEYEGISAKDKHPNPLDHRKIAAAIANSFVSQILNGIEDSGK